MYNYIYIYISFGLLIGLELPATRSMAGLIRRFDGVATCQNCILGSPPSPNMPADSEGYFLEGKY